MSEERFPLYQTQVQTYVGFTSFMTAVVVFFTGLLLSSFHNYDFTVKIPIAFLIISIFGFLYSTLIYTSAAEEVAQKQEHRFRHHLYLGDMISEYLGVYLLVISIPMVVNALTNDGFLRTTTIASSIIGMAIYQFSHSSMVERHFKKTSKTISGVVLILSFLLFLSQIYQFHFVPAATIFIVFMVAVTYFASTQVPKLVEPQ